MNSFTIFWGEGWGQGGGGGGVLQNEHSKNRMSIQKTAQQQILEGSKIKGED